MNEQGGGGNKSGIWLKVLGVGCVIMIIIGAVAVWGIMQLFDVGKQERVKMYASEVVPNIESEAKKTEVEQALSALVDLTEKGDLGFTQFTLVENTVTEVNLDNVITDEECERLLTLLRSITDEGGANDMKDAEGGG